MNDDSKLADTQTNNRQVFNAVDRAMLCVNRVLESMGCPGFETQVLVWLNGRLELPRLRAALSRLRRNYPVVTSRLVDRGGEGRPYWCFCADAECQVHEVNLGSSSRDDVSRYAAHLLSAPHDLTRSDPIRFYLIHLADERDVFLIQYNHMLMDNNAAELLLREINRLACESAHDTSGAYGDPPQRPVSRYLKRFSHQRKKKAARSMLDLQRRELPGRPVKLSTSDAETTGSIGFQFASRSLDQDATALLRSRVVEVCGFPNVSMALIGSAFRAIARLAPPERLGTGNFVTGVGIDLGLRGERGPIFQNLMSLVPIHARLADLDDREELLRRLSRQFRERLSSEIDLGALRLVALYSRNPRRARWVVEPLMHYGYTLWYGYFGSLDLPGDEFCGVEIEDVFHTGPTWPPMGMTLIANEFRGRLRLQATYVPESVPPPLAERFLEEIVDELTAI